MKIHGVLVTDERKRERQTDRQTDGRTERQTEDREDGTDRESKA